MTISRELTGGYTTSRDWLDDRETNLLKDKAFNRHSMNDGHHKSPYDNGMIQIGDDGIVVELVQGIDEKQFAKTLSMAQRATIGIDLNKDDEDFSDWEEMLQGGLQTALETQTIVFAVQGVSRTCTHQLVRSRKAAFHQQSQRASFYGNTPEVRMPESVWRNPKARMAFLEAKSAADRAYRIACEEDISYQDARYVMLEGTANYIMLEYPVREFLNVFAYRGCSMFSWEIVAVMRKCRMLLIEKYPWLKPYIQISCEKTGKCTFQGWEQVEGQCDLPYAREDNRTFRSKRHEIKQLPQVGEAKGPESFRSKGKGGPETVAESKESVENPTDAACTQGVEAVGSTPPAVEDGSGTAPRGCGRVPCDGEPGCAPDCPDCFPTKRVPGPGSTTFGGSAR